jgi:hypothetical protein
MAALPLLASLIHHILLAILNPVSEIKFPISWTWSNGHSQGSVGIGVGPPGLGPSGTDHPGVPIGPYKILPPPAGGGVDIRFW